MATTSNNTTNITDFTQQNKTKLPPSRLNMIFINIKPTRQGLIEKKTKTNKKRIDKYKQYLEKKQTDTNKI